DRLVDRRHPEAPGRLGGTGRLAHDVGHHRRRDRRRRWRRWGQRPVRRGRHVVVRPALEGVGPIAHHSSSSWTSVKPSGGGGTTRRTWPSSVALADATIDLVSDRAHSWSAAAGLTPSFTM